MKVCVVLAGEDLPMERRLLQRLGLTATPYVCGEVKSRYFPRPRPVLIPSFARSAQSWQEREWVEVVGNVQHILRLRRLQAPYHHAK